MSTEENKALVRRFCEECYNKGDLDVFDEIVDPEWVNHSPDGTTMHRDDFREMVGSRELFPDMKITIEDMIAEGDKVVVRRTTTGTHKGEFMGIAATGKQVTTSGIVVQRYAAGKLAESWTNNDDLGMLRQLGALPADLQ